VPLVAAKKWRSRPSKKRHFPPISSSILTVLSVFFGIHFQNCAIRRELSPKITAFRDVPSQRCSPRFSKLYRSLPIPGDGQPGPRVDNRE
jgi:hypothetical protein